jgi:hypothetical protein
MYSAARQGGFFYVRKGKIMAFSVPNLSVLAYANGFTLWHYKAPVEDDDAGHSPGYFMQAGDLLNAGDMIMVSGGGQGRILCVCPGPSGLTVAPL